MEYKGENEGGDKEGAEEGVKSRRKVEMEAVDVEEGGEEEERGKKKKRKAQRKEVRRRRRKEKERRGKLGKGE